VDETYVKVAGRWTYLYRAVDEFGEIIDVLVSTRRNADASRAFFARAATFGPGSGRSQHRQGAGLPAASSTSSPRRHGTSSSTPTMPDKVITDASKPGPEPCVG
jgi:transposase, IS6 family